MRRAAFLSVLLVPLLPATASAAAGADVHPLSVAPFAALLLCIAVLPLLAPRFWHRNRNRALVSLGLAAPVAVYLLLRAGPTGGASVTALLHGLGEYVSFIALLGSLYVVAGGVVVRGDPRGSPGRNTLLLGLGALLANV